MLDIGLFKTVRDLLGMFGGFISAANRVGKATDKAAEAIEEAAELMLQDVRNSRTEAQLAYLTKLEANS